MDNRKNLKLEKKEKRKMNLKKLNLTVLLVTIIVLVPTIQIVYASPLSTFYLSGGVYPQGTYTIWKEGTKYYAKNGYGLHTSESGSTNASYVINNALDSMTKGGILHFAPDYFWTDSPIQIDYTKLPIIIEGEGMLLDYPSTYNRGTYIICQGTGGNALEFKNVPAGVTNYADLTIHNIGLYVDTDLGTYNAVISLNRINNLRMDTVHLMCGVNNVPTYGLQITNSTDGNHGVLNNVFINGRFNYSIHSDLAWTTLTGCHWNNFANYGAYFEESNGIRIFGARIGTSMNQTKGDNCVAGVYFNNVWGSLLEIYDESTSGASGSGAGANYLPFIANGSLAKMWLFGCKSSPYGAHGTYGESNSGMVICIASVYEISTATLGGDNFWLNWSPRISHPDTSNWGTNMTGTMWYDTTYNNYEYWNGTDCIYWNATGVGVQP